MFVSKAAAFGLSLTVAWSLLFSPVTGQEKAPAAGAAAKLEAAPAKADPPKTDAKGAVSTSGERKEVGQGDQLGFTQAKVAAEMSELEERMYRLSEAIKALEPENSSRLMMGLKFAREELILHQMKQIEEQLAKLSLSDAVTEQKQLMAKLQRLQELLLSIDLDFQMRLERLRMMREAIKRINVAIKEEDRELKASTASAGAEQKREGLKKKQKSLDDIIKQQTAHVAKGEELGKAESPDSDASSALSDQQESTRRAAEALAADTSQPVDREKLRESAGKMGESAQSLKGNQPKEAQPAMQQALDILKGEERRIAEELKAAEEQLAAERFLAMKKDQEANRQATEGISDLVKQLGESGAGALSELIRAGGSMSNAEGDLGQSKPSPASQQQDAALKSLKYALEQLQDEEQKLLERLRAELKKKVIEGLSLMLERQEAIRKSTESLGPGVAKGSRPAITSVVGLSKQEQSLVDLADDLITLVEETEFGIALPATLGVVRDEMDAVKGMLAKGEASAPVVAAEKQVEEDLKALLKAMEQLPSSRPPEGKARRGNPQDQERELNRLVAELKMIRLLQVRLNTETTSVDKRRAAAAAALSADIKQRIEDLQGRQEDIRDVTEKLAADRGDELQ